MLLAFDDGLVDVDHAVLCHYLCLSNGLGQYWDTRAAKVEPARVRQRPQRCCQGRREGLGIFLIKGCRCGVEGWAAALWRWGRRWVCAAGGASGGRLQPARPQSIGPLTSTSSSRVIAVELGFVRIMHASKQSDGVGDDQRGVYEVRVCLGTFLALAKPKPFPGNQVFVGVWPGQSLRPGP